MIVIKRTKIKFSDKEQSTKLKEFKYLYKYKIEDKYYFLNLATEEIIELETDSLLNASLETQKYLFKHYFLINEEEDSKAISDTLYEQIKPKARGSKQYINKFTILTTTDCNARCFYCYEKGCEREPMSAKTAEDIADFIISKYPDGKIKISWFGGEPLYNKEVIDIISNKLKENNIKFSSTMISNGYLLTEEVAKHAKENWNLNHVQITLDGPNEIYDKIKAYIYNEPNAFERVLNNIDTALKSGIGVNVRLNISKSNIKEMSELVEILNTRFNKEYIKSIESKFRVGGHLLFQIEQSKDIITKDFEDDFIELIKKINKYWGRQKRLRKLKLSASCGTSNRSNVIIMPNGDLYPCEHFNQCEKFGSIYGETVKSEEVLNHWTETTRLSEDCEDCKYYPICVFNKNCPGRMHYCNNIYKRERNMAIIYIIKKAIKDYNKNKSE